MKIKHPHPGATPEVLVVGAGLAGLLAAAFELKKGKSVHLTEKLPQVGGRWSPEVRDGYRLGAGFAFADSAWWRGVSDLLSLPAQTTAVADGGALVHGSRGWVAPEEVPPWEEYLSRPCSEFPVGGLSGITEMLMQFFESQERFTFSTELPVTALTVVEGRVAEVGLGADLAIRPGEVVWCADYKTLQEVIRGEGVPEPGPERVSWMKKFSKTIAQPGVVLEFAHRGRPADFTETMLLPFSAGEKEERRYLVGAFSSNRDPSLAPAGASLSSWICPLTEAEWGDNHESMKKIRSARRLLDKAFPGFDQSLVFDRVLVLDSTFSPLKKKKGDWQPLLPNLRLGADWAVPTGATFEGLAETLKGL